MARKRGNSEGCIYQRRRQLARPASSARSKAKFLGKVSARMPGMA